MKTKMEKMINVPTALFIDTQYYCSQGLKFTATEINALKKQFKLKSLRLILPDVACRELEKKFGELGQKMPVAFNALLPFPSRPFSPPLRVPFPSAGGAADSSPR